MFETHLLNTPRFLFSDTDRRAVSVDKFQGIRKYGPYAGLPTVDPPRLGFVFPDEYKNHANRLFQVLRNGVGAFPGIHAMFKVPLESQQVFRATTFSIKGETNSSKLAMLYEDALKKWDPDNNRADILVVIHPKTSVWQEETPYYKAKARALSHGVPSQHVTIDLLDNAGQLQWSAAEIALQLFVKLGGVPWVIEEQRSRHSIIIGVGKTQMPDPTGVPGDTAAAFATCLTSAGPLAFTAVGEVAGSRDQYIQSLKHVVLKSILDVKQGGSLPESITVHVSQRFGREEVNAVELAITESGIVSSIPCYIVVLSREREFYCVDPDEAYGSPSRGLVIKLDNNQRIVYTEGREDRASYRLRLPTAIRIRAATSDDPKAVSQFVEDAFQLSLVNYRGFRSFSEPATMVYSKLIARFLSHLSVADVAAVRKRSEVGPMSRGMWFL